MKLLALETATEVCSIALLYDDQPVAVVEERVPRKHAEMLPLFYQELALKTKFNLADLDGIAISIGPGSFTGLRIGLSFAKGLAYGHGLPLIPIPTLLALISGINEKTGRMKMMLFSHRDRIYHQDFEIQSNNLIELTEPASVAWSDIVDQFTDYDKLVHCGCETLLENEVKLIVPAVPSAVLIGKLAVRNYAEWLIRNPFQLVPNYISPFEFSK
ncbi:MAG: tRNA (adenosine(37)-N6)-threonylcarbamoyltransferase complex dimerization subunit type 1 TsaB [Candidatus Marinimicrobia bacterium]|nr:tRNA (adenosine(37)-N6)-threonylcarbamoyltransferase complex dimerization subunit type 1 TsaB [Candidatus Neomarinimicrobiota bacterium]